MASLSRLGGEEAIHIKGPFFGEEEVDGTSDFVREDRERQSASVVKVVCGDGGRALYFSRAPIPFIRDEPAAARLDVYRRHVGIYAYRRAFLDRLVRTPPCALERLEKLEQLRALHIGARMVVLETAEVGVGVDTPEDVPYVEGLLKARGGGAAGGASRPVFPDSTPPPGFGNNSGVR